MSLFSWKKEKAPVSLVLDIGNASVGGALISHIPGQKPVVLFSSRVPMTLDDKPSAERLETALYTYLDNCLSYISRVGFTHNYFLTHPKKIDSVLVTCASPWFVSKTKAINIQQEKAFVVSKSFLSSVVKEEARLFKEELYGGGGGDLFVEELEVVEKSITHIKINGYIMQNPLDQKTNSLTALVYFGVIPKTIHESIISHIERAFHIEKEHILFHTFPLVTYSVLRDIFPKEDAYILFDIAGETTDISLVVDSVLYETVTFPSAKNFLLRHIASLTGAPLEVARSYIRMYQNKLLSDDISTLVDKAIIDIENEWNIYLADALETLRQHHTLPYKVFVTTDTDTAPFFIDFIKKEKTDTTASWRTHVRITHIDPHIIAPHLTLEPFAPCDEFTAIEGLFLHKFVA
jgi:hypothetical protein